MKDKSSLLEYLFKLLWIIATFYTIITWIRMSFFGYLIQNSISKEQQLTFWNFIVPSLVIIVLTIYFAKELVFGYHPKSKYQNKKSLVILSIIITITSILLFKYFRWMFIEALSHDFSITLSFVVALTSMLCLIFNRLRSIKNKSLFQL